MIFIPVPICLLWSCLLMNMAWCLLIEWLEIEADLKSVMNECAEFRILSSTPHPLGWKLKVTVQRQSRAEGGGAEFISECLGPLIPHHNSVLVISCFSPPDASKWISRAHPPVIGFWGKVFKLTLEKGGVHSSLIESAVVREQGRHSFVQSCQECLRLKLCASPCQVTEIHPVNRRLLWAFLRGVE